jgi:hypothetical protein
MVSLKKVQQRYIQRPKYQLQTYSFSDPTKFMALYTTKFILNGSMSFVVSLKVLQVRNRQVLHFLKMTKNLPLLSTKMFWGFKSLCKTFLPWQ